MLIPAILLIFSLSLCQPGYSAKQSFHRPLHLNDLCQSFSFQADADFRGKVLFHLINFTEQNFSKIYQTIYKEIQENRSKEKVKDKAAALMAMILICQNFSIEPMQRISGLRLALEAIKSNFDNRKIALSISRLDNEFKIFQDNEEISRRFRSYIRLVWAKQLKPKLLSEKKLTPEINDFLAAFPWLRSETEAQISALKAVPERWEYVLEEGKSGENESDYILMKVDSSDQSN